MDVFTVLREDHQTAESIFQKIERQFGEADTPERHELFRRLKAELDLHAKVEDLHVYRVFQRRRGTVQRKRWKHTERSKHCSMNSRPPEPMTLVGLQV
jgi:hemerythrin HHE cation binding domain-containing protein